MKSLFRSLPINLLCSCPLSAEIADIPTDECAQYIGQIQKFMVQRTKNGSALNTITIASTNPNLLATWTALQAASDDTKVQTSPFIHEPVSEEGTARAYGGGNATLGGIPFLLGRNPSPFSCKLLNVVQRIVAALKSYSCEKELSVFLIAEDQRIWGIVDDVTTPTTFRGIPIQQFFVSDLVMGGFEAPDYNTIRWAFKGDWSDYLYAVTPTDFDSLIQL